MKLATTTGDFDRYCNNYCDCIRNVCSSGFRYIDLGFKSIRVASEENLFSDDWKKGAMKIKNCAEELGAVFVQAHMLPEQNLYAPGVDKETVRKNMIRCIEVCSMLRIPYIVLHGQRSDEFSFDKDKWLDVNRATLLSLVPWLEEAGVNLLIENGPKKHAMAFKPDGGMYDPPKYYCSYTTGKEMMEFIKYVDHPMIHACWDTGHGNMDGMQYENLVTLGDELRALHIHDNSGERDMHMMPYFGTMNLDDLMHGLIDSGYKGYFTFEACNSLGVECYRKLERRQFEADSRLYTLPLEIKLSAEKLMYQIGEYILKTYGCFEE